MDKYEEAVRIVNNYIRGLKECYENACDIVGDKSKTPAVRAKHARNAEEFYTLYNEVNCILQDILFHLMNQKRSPNKGSFFFSLKSQFLL